MKRIIAIFCLSMAGIICVKAQVRHVILISIDGMHPDMYLDKSWPTPNLQLLMRQGTYADRCLSVFPAYTHPAHAAMTTGALPARSGIAYNQPKDSHGEWNWYYNSIKAPTIWQALKDTHQTTAAIMWPNVVDGPITYNLGELWDENHPDDRATPVRQHAIPKGIYEEIEKNATGKLDSTSMNDSYLSLDENTGRMAAYILKTYRPSFMAVHFACVDGAEHDHGRDGDSVRLAVAANDRAIGDILQSIRQNKLQDSTAVIVVGDHGFSTMHQALRPNLLIKNLPARFIAAGGSCFLYKTKGATITNDAIAKSVQDSLEKLPRNIRQLFRFLNRKQLDQIGADSDALLALAADPKTGTVFSGSTTAAPAKNYGPGTSIQQNKYDGLLVPVSGGHHGYDPQEPDMWTGFIAWGAGIQKGGHLIEMKLVDISPLIAKLLRIKFNTPDGKLPGGIIQAAP